MRLLVAFVLATTLCVAASPNAPASRPPSAGERTAIARAVLLQLERDSPKVTVRVNRVVVSTKRPGVRSIYSQFAAANASGRDASVKLIGSPLRVLVAFSRRFRTWVVINYGSSDVGCSEPQSFFGGRRKAILRDLRFGCG